MFLSCWNYVMVIGGSGILIVLLFLVLVRCYMVFFKLIFFYLVVYSFIFWQQSNKSNFIVSLFWILKFFVSFIVVNSCFSLLVFKQCFLVFFCLLVLDILKVVVGFILRMWCLILQLNICCVQCSILLVIVGVFLVRMFCSILLIWWGFILLVFKWLMFGLMFLLI